mmetsp:Transcript_27071/g.62602  ORF Transcript_27071/g.62602 Transcript_27071/m.62602 type:complete len:484 (-) Transcript_27071:69-1520(-)
MATKDARPSIKLDLASPRVLAAMKLLGLHEQDLEVPNRGSQTERSHNEQYRLEVLEARRHNLLRDVQQKAQLLQDEHVDTILTSDAASTSEKEQSVVFDDLRCRIDNGRERDKAVLERKIAGQLKKREMREAYDSKWEATSLRVKESKQEEETDSTKRLEAKQRKIEERIAAAAKEEVANRRKVLEKMQESSKRTQKQLDVRMKRLEEARDERMKKMAQASERNEKHEMEEQQSKLKQHHQVLERRKELDAWKEKQREETLKASEERSTRFMQRMQQVEEALKEQLALREKACLETLDKLEKARQAAAQAKDDVIERVKLHREKEEKKWAENRRRVAEARREKVSTWKSSLASKDERGQTLREQYLANTVGEKAANRALFREIVDMNKERLQRSNDTARELTLAKIQVGNAKLDAEKEQRNKALKYHAEVLKETLTHRALVGELSLAAPPKRVNQVLQELGMEARALPPEGKVKEGEEAIDRP